MTSERFCVFVGGAFLGLGLATVAAVPLVVVSRKAAAAPCQCACHHPAGEAWDNRPHISDPPPGARLQSGDPLPTDPEMGKDDRP